MARLARRGSDVLAPGDGGLRTGSCRLRGRKLPCTTNHAD